MLLKYIGVGDGDRTRDIRSHSPTLYRLSYSHHCGTSSVYAKSAAAESASECLRFVDIRWQSAHTN